MNEIKRSQISQILDYTTAASATVGAISYGFKNPIANKISKIALCTFVTSGFTRYCLPRSYADTEHTAELVRRCLFVTSDFTRYCFPPSYAETQQTAELVRRCLNDDADELDRNNIIAFLKAMPIRERSNLVESACSLFNQKTAIYADLLWEVAAIPAVERVEVINQTRGLITPDMPHWRCTGLLKMIAGISKTERKDVIDKANHLFTPTMSGEVKWCIISDLASMSAADRRDIVRLALPLLTTTMDAWDRSRIISALTSMPAADRRGIVEQASLLLTPIIGTKDLTKIISAVASVPSGDRDYFVQQAHSLFTPTMNGEDRQLIISALASVPAADRRDVVEQVRLLFTETTNGKKCQRMIAAVASVPAADRHDVVQQALLLCIPGVRRKRAFNIISALASVPAADRHDVVQHARFLCVPTMNGDQCDSIISAVASVPSAERRDFVHVASTVIFPNMSLLQIGFSLGQVARLSARERRLLYQRDQQTQRALQQRSFVQNKRHLNDRNATLEQRLHGWGREFETAFPGHQRAITDFGPFLISLGEYETSNLNQYLRRITEIEDFQMDATPEAQKNVIRRVENMIQLACAKPVFKEKMLDLVAQGVTSCQDRILLCFNDIEVLHELHRLKREDGPFSIVANKASTYHLLKKHALKISKENNLPDPIETILAYQIELREDLVLPISTERMSSALLGNVSDDMLREAQMRIESYTPRQLLELSEDWQERMSEKYPKEAQVIRDKYQTIYAGAIKYYGHPGSVEERAAWLAQWLNKHPECVWLKTLVSDPGVKNCVDAGEAVQETQGIELAHLGGILNNLLPLEANEGKQ